MEDHERVPAVQGVFDAKALLKVREAYKGVLNNLDPDATSQPNQRAEIADALFHLVKLNPDISPVELSIHLIDYLSKRR